MTFEVLQTIPYVIGSARDLQDPNIYGGKIEKRALSGPQTFMHKALSEIAGRGLYPLFDEYNQAALQVVNDIVSAVLHKPTLPPELFCESAIDYYRRDASYVKGAISLLPQQRGRVPFTADMCPDPEVPFTGAIPLVTTTQIKRIIQPVWRSLLSAELLM